MEFERGFAANWLSSKFYENNNTINIYTEDSDENKRFYEELFKKLLDGTGIDVNNVHQLGNCKDVVKHCKEDNDTSMPKLYIIDGDIYLMTTPKRAEEHLYIIDAYCIENKVIDENAYYEVFSNLDYAHDKDEIKKLANYEDMMKAAESPFLNLYCHMAVCRETVDIHRGKSAKCIMSGHKISLSKLDKECEEIKDLVVKYSDIDENEFQKRVDAKLGLFPPCRENLMKYVSGKDFLLVYIDEYTKNKLKSMSGQKKEFWKFQFMQHSDLSQLEGLKNAIIKEVEEFNQKQKEAS